MSEPSTTTELNIKANNKNKHDRSWRQTNGVHWMYCTNNDPWMERIFSRTRINE